MNSPHDASAADRAQESHPSTNSETNNTAPAVHPSVAAPSVDPVATRHIHLLLSVAAICFIAAVALIGTAFAILYNPPPPSIQYYSVMTAALGAGTWLVRFCRNVILGVAKVLEDERFYRSLEGLPAHAQLQLRLIKLQKVEHAGFSPRHTSSTAAISSPETPQA